MTISRLPSGRYRAQIYFQGKRLSVATVLGEDESSYPNERAARKAFARAQVLLDARREQSAVTVNQFRDRWLTDPLFSRPKESTLILNRDATKKFAQEYGHLPISEIADAHVEKWLRDPKHHWTVPALRVMFNDACKAKAGRLVKVNPFANLGLTRTKGNQGVTPPPEEVVWSLIASARKHSLPSYAAWLQVAAFTGMRPGELDALKWDQLLWEDKRIAVMEQFSGTSRTFTAPKNGKARLAILTRPAREALLSLPRESEFCFTTLRRTHWTPAARAYHWKAVKAGTDYEGTVYLATRHFFGWYAINVLRMTPEDVAVAMGHTDGGYLVRTLYGHLDQQDALKRVAEAFDGQGKVVQLKAVKEEAG